MVANPKQLVDETVDLYLPMQVYEELVEFTAFLTKRKLTNVLEIGSHRCGMLNILAKIATGKILSVDAYPVGAEIYRRAFSSNCPHVRLIEGFSQDAVVKKSVETLLNGESLDLLLIDGDHSKHGLIYDINQYFPLVAQHGIIVLHDIDPQHALLTAPAKVWLTLKEDVRFKSSEIIYAGITPGVDYSDRKSLREMTNLLYHHPKLFRAKYPTINGLPSRMGGFGILSKH